MSFPTRAYCSAVSSKVATLGHNQPFFLCEMSLRWPLSIIPIVFNVCTFYRGSTVSSLPQFPHTSSGSMGPSAPWGLSVWSRRMGLLHMGHTLRISSHLSRHLRGHTHTRDLSTDLFLFLLAYNGMRMVLAVRMQLANPTKDHLMLHWIKIQVPASWKVMDLNFFFFFLNPHRCISLALFFVIKCATEPPLPDEFSGQSRYTLTVCLK